MLLEVLKYTLSKIPLRIVAIAPNLAYVTGLTHVKKNIGWQCEAQRKSNLTEKYMKLPHLTKYEWCHQLKIHCIPLADNNFERFSLKTQYFFFASTAKTYHVQSDVLQHWNLVRMGHVKAWCIARGFGNWRIRILPRNASVTATGLCNALGYKGICCPCIEFTERTKATAREWDLVEMFFWRGTSFWFTVQSPLIRVSSSMSPSEPEGNFL